MTVHKPWWSILTYKPVLATLAAGLLLVAYICFLVVFNFRSQTALQSSAMNRHRLNLEKQAASLGYFLSERKYDVSFLAGSREINTYFTNKALGMTEAYGLKVNLFLIEQVLRKTLDNKRIQKDRIYCRLAFLDASGRYLVDTGDMAEKGQAVYRKPHQKALEANPFFCMGQENDTPRAIMASPCYFKGKIAGNLVAWLDCESMFSHFVFKDIPSDLKGACIVDKYGSLLSVSRKHKQGMPSCLTAEQIRNLPVADFSLLPFSSASKIHEVLVARLPVPNFDIDYVAWMPNEQIAAFPKPRHWVIAMGALAVVILAGIALILWFATQRIILKTRFDESERQHGLLAAKNLQLKKEIKKRTEAEKELEMQRTLSMRSDRLRSLGEMAAGIAHELNQPLCGVRGFAEIILHGMDSGHEFSKKEIRSKTGKIVEQADRMVHIINHVRMFAREADSIETARVDLNEVVRSSTSLLSAQFSSHGFLLEIDLCSRNLPVKINPFSVEEVILNVLSNARQSIEQKSEMAGETYIPAVSVSTAEVVDNGKESALLTVADNGMGIPEDVAGRIFDPFFTTKDPDKGTGLGLSICKSIVESFQGDIQFTSTENTGARFEIRFPVCLK